MSNRRTSLRQVFCAHTYLVFVYCMKLSKKLRIIYYYLLYPVCHLR